jgi:hypothetical protein
MRIDDRNRNSLVSKTEKYSIRKRKYTLRIFKKKFNRKIKKLTSGNETDLQTRLDMPINRNSDK